MSAEVPLRNARQLEELDVPGREKLPRGRQRLQERGWVRYRHGRQRSETRRGLVRDDPRDSGTRVVSDQVHPLSAIPPGTPWNNGYIESFDNRLREDCLNRNHWTSLGEARVVIGDFKDEHKRRHRHSALGYLTPAEYAARCRHAHRPVTCDINS